MCTNPSDHIRAFPAPGHAHNDVALHPDQRLSQSSIHNNIEPGHQPATMPNTNTVILGDVHSTGYTHNFVDQPAHGNQTIKNHGDHGLQGGDPASWAAMLGQFSDAGTKLAKVNHELNSHRGAAAKLSSGSAHGPAVSNDLDALTSAVDGFLGAVLAIIGRLDARHDAEISRRIANVEAMSRQNEYNLEATNYSLTVGSVQIPHALDLAIAAQASTVGLSGRLDEVENDVSKAEDLGHATQALAVDLYTRMARLGAEVDDLRDGIHTRLF